MKKLQLLTLYFITIISVFGQSISYNEEFQVNTYTNDNQFSPSVSTLNNGSFVIAWQSGVKDGNGAGVFAQVYDEYKIKKGSEFQINSYTINDQWEPSICGLNNGGFIVSWESYSQDGDWYGIYAQVYDEYSRKMSDEFQVNTYINGSQWKPSVCELNNGGFVIVWQSYDQDGFWSGVYARLYDGLGEKISDEFLVNTYTYRAQEHPTVSSLNNGGFVVAWQSDDQDGNRVGVFAQIYDGHGFKKGDEFQVNTFTKGSQKGPSVCGLNNGGFVVAWESYIQDGDSFGIYAQIFDSIGVKTGNEFLVNTYTKETQWNPSVSGLIDSGFVITWQSRHQDGDNYGIYAQIYDDLGKKKWKEFLVNTYTDDNQSCPSVSGLNNGGFVVAWESDYQDGDWRGIFSKHYLSDPISHNLTEFEVLKPEIDATINIITPYFNWHSSTKTHINFIWELTYNLFIDTDNLFSNPIIIKGLQDTSYQIDSLTPGKTYFWKVLAKNYYGDSLWSSNINGFYIDPNATTDVEVTNNSVPDKFELQQNYPNPFNPSTKINYQVPTKSFVSIKVYNLIGEIVAELVNNVKPAGKYNVSFNASDLSSGVYYYRIQAGELNTTKKMILLR